MEVAIILIKYLSETFSKNTYNYFVMLTISKIIPLLKAIPKNTYNHPTMMLGPFPQMKNEDLEEDQIDSGYDIPENMTLEQYILYISYICI